MNTEGNSDIPAGGSSADGGADDGDFDLSGFADEGASAPAGERKAPKAPKGPRAGETGARGPGAKGPGAKGPGAKGPGKGYSGELRRFEKPGRGPAGGARTGGGPRGEGGSRFDRGPREGGFRKEFPDRPPRYGEGPRGAAGPRKDGGARGGFRDRESAFKPRFQDRGPGDGPRPFRPRGPGGDRPDGPRGGAPRDGGAPRRFAPRPAPVGGPEGAAFKPLSAEVKPWLSLKLDKGRWKESRFLLEGIKNISDALAASPAILHMAFATPEFKDKELLAQLKKHRVSVVPVDEWDIKALTDTETPQGIVAVCNFATLRPDWNLARYVTVLDAVQDPGNVGAIFRTSAALGMDAMILGKGSCDPYNPKVVRSSVGALLGMPFETGEELGSKLNFLRQKGFSVVATSSHAKQTLEQAKLRKKVALIVGNEGAGTGASYQDMADAVVKIPLKSKVESLNVAVAHGILSYQLIHGRE